MEYLDAIRGVALFGILLVNMQGFKLPLFSVHPTEMYLPGLANEIVHKLIEILAAWKFIAIFSFLFGCGLALLRENLLSRGILPGTMLFRRMLLLLPLGVAHGILLWAGDVLALYAIWGMAGIFLLRFRVRTLVILSASIYGLLLLELVLASVAAAVFGVSGHDGWREDTDAWVECYDQGSLAWIVSARFDDWVYIWLESVFYADPYSLAFCLLGMACGKSKVIREPDALLLKAGKWILPAMITGLVMVISHFAVEEVAPSVSYLTTIPLTMGNALVALSYLTFAAILFRSGRFRKAAGPLAAMGRLSLTNYLVQSLAANFIFMSWGLGMFGKMNAQSGLLLGMAIFWMQLRLSGWWLRRFRSGPIEWLWRWCAGGLVQGPRPGISPAPSPP